MKVSINAEEVEVTDTLTVAALLVEQKVKWADMVAVELNGTILDRPTFGTTVVQAGDKIEFLYFMGGGAAPDRATHVEARRP
jgi:sulfur carrier protein